MVDPINNIVVDSPSVTVKPAAKKAANAAIKAANKVSLNLNHRPLNCLTTAALRRGFVYFIQRQLSADSILPPALCPSGVYSLLLYMESSQQTFFVYHTFPFHSLIHQIVFHLCAPLVTNESTPLFPCQSNFSKFF